MAIPQRSPEPGSAAAIANDRLRNGGLWWSTAEDGDRRTLRGYDNELGDTEVIVDHGSVQSPTAPVVTVETDRRLHRVRSIVVVTSPALWWLEVPETRADPPAMTLIAFDTDESAPGRVVDDPSFHRMATAGSDQVGAIRWWPSTGLVHQIYVQPTRRRQGIGRALAFGAGGYSVARDWPQPWGDDRRTDLGEAFVTRASRAIASRAFSRAVVMPAMTPVSERDGVPRRLLEPDG